MNDFDDVDIRKESFSYRDIIGQDKWEAFTLTFTGLTIVGATTYSGRWRRVGRSVQFQAQFQAVTSIDSTAGTTYFALPIAPLGIAGIATMTNRTTNIAVGTCVIDVTNSRCYIPTQGASANLFNVCGSYEA